MFNVGSAYAIIVSFRIGWSVVHRIYIDPILCQKMYSIPRILTLYKGYHYEH
nr:MAG TPA: protein of unknown function DUF4516 [Bacteriophage sp.]